MSNSHNSAPFTQNDSGRSLSESVDAVHHDCSEVDHDHEHEACTDDFTPADPEEQRMAVESDVHADMM